MNVPRSSARSRVLGLLCGGLIALYLLLSLLYAHTGMLFSDDYLNLRAACQLVWGRPYVDFQPWNNLLGHYLHIPALLLNPDPVLAPIHIRIEMALLNTLLLALLTRHIARKFGTPAALAGLTLLVTMAFFLQTAILIRLDTFAAWAGFGALLAACGRRWLTAGLLCGLAFLCSHKGIYQIVSLNAGLFCLFCVSRERRAVWRAGVRLNAAAALPCAAYYLFSFLYWDAAGAVAGNLEYKAHTLVGFYQLKDIFQMSLEYIYLHSYLFSALALFGAGLFGLAALRGRSIPAACKSEVGRTEPPLDPEPALQTGYLAALAGCCALHPHPYAYFFILTIPPLWYCACQALGWTFAWFERCKQERQSSCIVLGAALALLLCGLWIPRPLWTPNFIFVMSVVFPAAMLAVCLPLHLLCRRLGQRRPEALPGLFLGVVVLIILCASDARFLFTRFSTTIPFQRHMIETFVEDDLRRVREVLQGRPPTLPAARPSAAAPAAAAPTGGLDRSRATEQ